MKGKLKKMYWEILEIDNNVLYNVGLQLSDTNNKDLQFSIWVFDREID